VTTRRVVHIGDLHLGPNSRNDDRLAALDQILREQEPTDVALWVWPGDVNHGRMTIADRNALVPRVQRMADVAPVVICYGNHDLPGDLDFLEELKARHAIYVVARPKMLLVPLAGGGPLAAIFVLPYPTRAGLVAAGIQTEGVVDAARAALDLLFLQATADLRDYAAKGVLTLMIGHVNVAGSILSAGQPNIGREIELDPLLIGRLGGIYVGLNHIHKGQEIGGAHYPGSCCRLDWGEVEEKHYLVVTYGQGDEMREGATAADGWLYDVTVKPLDVAPMYHVEGILTREGFVWGLAGSSSAGPLEVVFPEIPSSFEGCDVRVRYRYDAAEREALDEAAVRAPFVGARRLELDPIAVKARASRAPEVAAAVTLEGKVEAFVRASQVRWTLGLGAKLDQLQSQPDGAAFLTSISSALSPAPAPQPTPELVEAL
jgi:DNA repair exonuclease SbcCD nuclease subunit